MRYPWRCLCFGTSQITRTTPLRLMILHLSHIFLTLALTFMFPSPWFVRPNFQWDSGLVRSRLQQATANARGDYTHRSPQTATASR